MASKKVEELVLAVCRKHPEGVQDTALEAELPGVAVDERAVAINALLAAETANYAEGPGCVLQPWKE